MLFIVHPDSALGSADFNIGKTLARSGRDLLVREYRNWRGGVTLFTGGFVEEFSTMPVYADALHGCLDRAQSAGLPAMSVSAPDPAQVKACIVVAKKLHLAKDCPIVCTGAWTTADLQDDGCVNSVYHALLRAGFTNVTISESAMSIDLDGEQEDDDYFESAGIRNLIKIVESRSDRIPDFGYDPVEALRYYGDKNQNGFEEIKHDPEQHDKARPLAIIVHPGDMVEQGDWDDPAAHRRLRRFSQANQNGTAQELRELRLAGYDTVIIHRESCSQITFGDDCDDEFVGEIWDAGRKGSVTFGDDLESAVRWIVANLHIGDRPNIFLLGAYNTPENGCLTYIGTELEKIVGEDRISVSSHSPPGNSPGKLWRPGNRKIPYSKRHGDEWRSLPRGKP